MGRHADRVLVGALTAEIVLPPEVIVFASIAFVILIVLLVGLIIWESLRDRD